MSGAKSELTITMECGVVLLATSGSQLRDDMFSHMRACESKECPETLRNLNQGAN